MQTYWRGRLFLNGGTPRVAELGHALRGSPGSSIAGAADLVVELDVLSRTRHRVRRETPVAPGSGGLYRGSRRRTDGKARWSKRCIE
jgi:hypothetical protein